MRNLARVVPRSRVRLNVPRMSGIDGLAMTAELELESEREGGREVQYISTIGDLGSCIRYGRPAASLLLSS